MKKYDNTKNVENIKTSKYFKKADWIVALVMLIALVGMIVLLCMPKGERVVIRVNGEVKYVYKLNEDKEINLAFDGEENANVVVIKDGQVYIKSATCDNQVCVKSGKISKVGETITCLPHKLSIEIVGANSEVDVVI